MTRHAKNCTAGAVYTYHEKKRDTKSSGYGSQNIRLGKDSIKDFDCCCLSLQPCRNPVVTPDGYLYDKEAVLEYIIHQKKEITRKLKEFEKQKKKTEETEIREKAAQSSGQVKKFIEKENSIVSKPYDAFKSADPGEGTSTQELSNTKGDKAKTLPSFWLPCLTPKAAATECKKPDEKVRCPMSGKPLKLKDLIDVNFKHINDGDSKTALIVKQDRYVCAVTNDVLGNSVPCAVLRTSGSVVTCECIEKIIKKDMLDPINGKKMTEKDFIVIKRGATGFSGSGLKLDAKKAGPALMS